MELSDIVAKQIHHFVSLSRKDEGDLIRYCGDCKSLINMQDRPILLTQEQQGMLFKLYPPHDEAMRLQYLLVMCTSCKYNLDNKKP